MKETKMERGPLSDRGAQLLPYTNEITKLTEDVQKQGRTTYQCNFQGLYISPTI